MGIVAQGLFPTDTTYTLSRGVQVTETSRASWFSLVLRSPRNLRVFISSKIMCLTAKARGSIESREGYCSDVFMGKF